VPEYVEGNRLTLLKNGEQYFPALVGAIDAAREEIFLESYIFASDETGSLVADALARAAARGVRVEALSAYHREQPVRPGLALGFAGVEPDAFPDALVRLEAAIRGGPR